MWEAVYKNAIDNWLDTNVSPPFFEMNLDQSTWDEANQNVLKDEILSRVSQPRDLNPSDLGKYIGRAAMLYVA